MGTPAQLSQPPCSEKLWRDTMYDSSAWSPSCPRQHLTYGTVNGLEIPSSMVRLHHLTEDASHSFRLVSRHWVADVHKRLMEQGQGWKMSLLPQKPLEGRGGNKITRNYSAGLQMVRKIRRRGDRVSFAHASIALIGGVWHECLMSVLIYGRLLYTLLHSG